MSLPTWQGPIASPFSTDMGPGGATPRFWTPTTPPTNCRPEAPWGGGGGGGGGGLGGGGLGGAPGRGRGVAPPGDMGSKLTHLLTQSTFACTRGWGFGLGCKKRGKRMVWVRYEGEGEGTELFAVEGTLISSSREVAKCHWEELMGRL